MVQFAAEAGGELRNVIRRKSGMRAGKEKEIPSRRFTVPD